MRMPVTRGPDECPISIMDDMAPIDAPISSFFAISPIYFVVATVEKDIPRPDIRLMMNNAGREEKNGMNETGTPRRRIPITI